MIIIVNINDSDNDYFYPSIIGGNNYNMKIYDRWGGIIYNEDKTNHLKIT